MRSCVKTYKILQSSSALFFVILLAWLTVSGYFIYETQQKTSELKDYVSQNGHAEHQNDFPGDPLSGNTEEKAGSGSFSLLEEYIHEPAEMIHFVSASTTYRGHADELFVAFHGELLSPPPEV